MSLFVLFALAVIALGLLDFARAAYQHTRAPAPRAPRPDWWNIDPLPAVPEPSGFFALQAAADRAQMLAMQHMGESQFPRNQLTYGRMHAERDADLRRAQLTRVYDAFRENLGHDARVRSRPYTPPQDAA